MSYKVTHFSAIATMVLLVPLAVAGCLGPEADEAASDEAASDEAASDEAVSHRALEPGSGIGLSKTNSNQTSHARPAPRQPSDADGDPTPCPQVPGQPGGNGPDCRTEPIGH
jgi:hypothetical protein